MVFYKGILGNCHTYMDLIPFLRDTGVAIMGFEEATSNFSFDKMAQSLISSYTMKNNTINNARDILLYTQFNADIFDNDEVVFNEVHFFYIQWN